MGEIGLDIEALDAEAGKKHWVEDPIWQGTREAVESILGADDYLEQYFATNVVFEPLVAELFRSGFIMQAAAAQNDFVTPTVVSAAEADYEQNLANTVELFHMLAEDPSHGKANRAVMEGWLKKHGSLASKAAAQLQPIWSLPRVKVAQFPEAMASAANRLAAICQEIGIKVPATAPAA